MPAPLEKSILATLHFFDQFEYPLTLLEIHRYLYKGSWWNDEVFEASLPEVITQLGEMALSIESSEGFYFLTGREKLVKIRARRYLASCEKFKKAVFVCEILSLLPSVRQIYVVNTLAYGNAKSTSDIDLLIVTHPRGLWTARFFCVSLLKLLRARPGLQNKIGQTSLLDHLRADTEGKNAFCLTFFLGQGSLDIQSIAYTPSDPYLVFWIAQAICIYKSDTRAMSLMNANRWIKRFLPNAREPHAPAFLRIRAHASVPHLGGVFEKAVSAFQRAIMPAVLKKAQNDPSGGVMINERMLKFHLNDRRESYAKEFQNRLNTFVL
jgi:hypothetical protein